MQRLRILIFLAFCQITLNGQDIIQVHTYKTTDDYISKVPMDSAVDLQIKKNGDNYIWYKNFVDTKTGQTIKKTHTSWAIKYEGEIYFNLYQFNLGMSHKILQIKRISSRQKTQM